MTPPLCAGCREHVPQDSDHTRVEVKQVRTDGPDEITTYYFHDECAREETEEWEPPA